MTNLVYFQAVQKALASIGVPTDKCILSHKEREGSFIIDPRFGTSTSLWDCSSFKEGSYGNVPVAGCLVIKKHSSTRWDYITIEVIPPLEWYHSDAVQAAKNIVNTLLKRGYAVKDWKKPIGRSFTEPLPESFHEYMEAWERIETLKKEGKESKEKFLAGNTAKDFIETLVVSYDPRLARYQSWESRGSLEVKECYSYASSLIVIVTSPLLGGESLRFSIKESEMTPEVISEKIWKATKRKMKVIFS